METKHRGRFMARCKNTTKLEVHHKNRSGSNGLDNAEVLCQDCHGKTASYGQPGKSPPDFSDAVKQAALRIAGNQCECGRDHCH